MSLKAWIIGWMLIAALAGIAQGDELVLTDGRTVKGSFVGFRDHRFLFKTVDGKDVAEFTTRIRGIVIDKPCFVSAQFVTKKFDRVQFKGYLGFMVRLSNEEGALEEPVTLLKSMELAGEEVVAPQPPANNEQAQEAPEPPRLAPRPDSLMTPSPAGGRDWKRSGKWREVTSTAVQTISHGENVDIEQSLKKDVVNVVHFHLSSIHSSVRQGNYVETLAGKSRGRVVLRRLDIPDWKAPVCASLELTSLPQFWFYSRSGRLVKKLTERFTEADIEAALKESLRAP
jgi:hypothetical protein